MSEEAAELVSVTMSCFVCGKVLRPAFEDDLSTLQAWGAVIFTSPGNFGSHVFDEMDGSRLLINICDGCLVAGAERTVLSKPGRSIPKPPPILSRWVPPTFEQED